MAASGDRPEPRHRARQAALQMLYQWEMSGADVEEVLATHGAIRTIPLDEAGEAFARSLVRGTAERIGELDPLIEAHTQNWRLARLAVIDRLVLRLAVFELRHTATPRNVVINEALELARTFSSEDAVRFVNGVLDAVARTLEAERAAGPPRTADPGPH